jgi:signal transduction histidine kinase
VHSRWSARRTASGVTSGEGRGRLRRAHPNSGSAISGRTWVQVTAAQERARVTEEALVLALWALAPAHSSRSGSRMPARRARIESVHFDELVNDALRMNAGALTRHKVDVVRHLADLPALPLDRHRLLQILVNLISNAKQAMDGVTDRTLASSWAPASSIGVSSHRGGRQRRGHRA